MDEIIYDWEDFFADSKKLAELIAPSQPGSLIVVTKGGMFLGGMLSQYLNIPLIETVSVESYKDRENQGLKVLKEAIHNLPNPLIVDEITDSGQTLKYLREHYKARTAVLFYKPTTSVHKPDFYLHETAKWVKFPWELDPIV
jgi:hypoxanthine phosphoribosyltransferase